MKLRSTLTILSLFLLAAFSQAQDLVPNGSFENVTNNQLDDWDVLNGSPQVLNSVSITINGQTENQLPTFGNNLLLMQNASVVPSVATKRFAYANRPTSLSAQIMYFPQNANERYVFYVLLSKWDVDSNKRDTILSANIAGGNQVYPWQRLIVDISSVYRTSEIPDSAYILIAPSSNTAAAANTTLIIDDVKLVDYTASVAQVDNHFVGDIQLAPNPMVSTAQIDYQITTKSKVNINLYDVTGKLVKSILDTEQNSGKYSVEFNRDNLPAGIYFCTINTGNYSKTIKLVIN